MIISATADASYIDYLRVFVKSALKTNPAHCVWVQLIDCLEYKSELEDLGCYVSTTKPRVSLDKTKKHIKQDDAKALAQHSKGILTPEIRKQILFSEHECFCSHARFKHINMILQYLDPDECCIIADADTIIRQPLTYIEDVLQDHELCMRFDGTGKNIEFVNEGFIGIRKTTTTRGFFSYVGTLMASDEASHDWDYDTYALNKAYSKYPDISLFKLPAKYKDDKLRDESAVWSGSSLAKDNDRYKQEMALYR
ncbi:hypothetical protein H8E06_01165 [bacterium]|nr:hypothetical protein [bacterium]